MKKIIVFFMICLLLLVSFITNAKDVYEHSYKIYNENVYDELIDKLDGIKLPEFTKEEKEAIEYYKENPLNLGQYRFEYYYSNIDDKKIGINLYTEMVLQKLLDIKINVHEMEFVDVQENLNNGTVDIVPGIYAVTITDDNLSVTKPYAFDKIFVYSKDYLNITSIFELDGLKIGIPCNGTYIVESDVKFLAEHGVNISIQSYDTNEETMAAYENGEIDIIVSNVSKEFLQNGYYADEVETNILARKLRFAYNDSTINEHFISAIEKVFNIDYIKNNIKYADKVEYQVLLSKGLLFTEEEKQFIEKTKTKPIIFENFYDAEPIMYLDHTTNTYEGAIAEVWRRVSNVTGLKYTNIPSGTKNINEIFYDIENGIADGSMAKVYTSTSNRFLYTNPIFEVEYILIGTEDSPYIHSTNNLDGFNIGVISDTNASNYLFKNYSSENINDNFKNANELTEALKLGDVDYIVLNNFIYNDLYYTHKMYELSEMARFDYKSGFVSIFNKNNKDNEIAISIFNKAIHGIDIDDIERNYLNPKINIGILIKYLEARNYIIYGSLVFIFIGIAALVLQIIKKSKIAEEISKVDALTKVRNRYCLSLDFENGFNKNQIIFYIDLDNFKVINDTFGHSSGDYILQQYAKHLETIEKGTVYRFGGDEFVIVITEENINNENLIKTINKCSYLDIKDSRNGLIHKLQASIGVINLNLFNPEQISLSQALDLADFTMYLVKKNPNIKFKICDYKVVQNQKIMHIVAEKILKPLDESGVVPYFQPIFDLYENKIVAFETLARWNFENNFIYPDEFIPVIEQKGCIHILDLYMFEQALSKMEKWLNNGLVDDTMYITSNFSPLTLTIITIDDINNIFYKYNVPKENFVIEVTESFFADESAILLVIELKENGYKIAIDDFSAGHSSLNSLIKIDMDFTKIDKALVDTKKELLSNKSLITLRNIIRLLDELHSDIIIEGVENEHTVNLLKEIGIVRKVQGYYYSKPLCEKDLEQLILKTNK